MALIDINNTLEIYINSEIDKQKEDTSYEWTTNFNTTPLVLSGGNVINRLIVQSASVPNTFPQFNTDRNTFEVEIENGATSTHTIPDSLVFSSTANFATYLQGVINGLGGTVVITQDPATLRLKIENNDTNYIKFSTVGNYGKFWRKIGFAQSQDNDGDALKIDPSNNMSGLNYANLIATSKVYICMKNGILNNSYFGSGNNRLKFPVLVSFDIESGTGTYSTFISDDETFWNHDLLLSSQITDLDFIILDDHYEPLKIMGGGVKLSLIIKQFRKEKEHY